MNTKVTKDSSSSQVNAFQASVDSVSGVLNLPTSIWVPNEDGTALKIAASVGLARAYVKKAIINLDEVSVTGEAFLTGETTTVYDILTDSRWKYKDYAKEMGWKSALCVPIKSYGKVIGVISIYTFVSREFSEYEKRLLEHYATQIELTESYRRLFIIGENIERLITEEPKKVLNEIVRDACEVTGADSAVVYPFDPLREQFYDIESVAAHGLIEPLKLEERPRSKKGMAAFVMREGEVVRENIEEEDPEMLETSPFIRREGIAAFMGISLVVSGQKLGVLYINYRTPHTFNEGEKEIIRLFAHQAAIAINNSRLFQQARIRANALETLHNVGPYLISISGKPEELATILNRIAESAQAVLGTDLIDLYQYHQSRDEFGLPPIQVGERYEQSVVKDNILVDDILYQIVVLEKPKYTENAREDETLTKPFTAERVDQPEARFVVREKIESSAAIPLRVGSETVGVIFANFRTSQTFPDHQRELIELFANQAAIAINNSRLYQQLHDRVQALEKLHKAGMSLLSVSERKGRLDNILKGIAKAAQEVLGADLIELYQYDQSRDEYYLPPVQVGERFDPSVVKTVIYEDDVLHVIVKQRKPQYYPNALGEEKLVGDFEIPRPDKPSARFVVREQIKSSVAIPLVIEKEIVGVMFTNFRISQEFSRVQKNLIELFGHFGAIAIRNARLFKTIQKRLDERLCDIGTFQEITASMHKDKLGDVLSLIANKAVELTGAKYGGVWLVNKTRTALEFGGIAGSDRPTTELPLLPIGEDSINGWVVLNGKSYFCDDVSDDPHYREWYKDTRSEITVPLKFEARIIGTLNVESTVLNGFTKDHLQLLEAMAGQAAVVVQNARLLERLNILDDIGVELTAGIRLKEDDILELIHKQAQKLTGAQDMYIALYDEDTGIIRFGLATEHNKRVETDDRYRPRRADLKKRGKTEDIIFTRKPLLHKTLGETQAWYAQPGHAEFVSRAAPSWLGVPLLVGKRVIGVIAIYDLGQEYAYDEQDLQVFSSMASQAAIAFDNANLYYDINRNLQRRVDALDALKAIGSIITSDIKKTKSEIVELTFEQAQQLTGAQDLYIALYDNETGEISFQLATEKGKRVQYKSRIADMEKRGKTEEIIFTQKPILHKTQQEANDWYDQPRRGEFIGKIQPSWLGVPMIAGAKVLGVIAAVDLERENAFDELHLDVLSSMAAYAAIALENARLFEAAREEVIATKQLATLGTAIAALQHRINNTFNIIIPNVTRLRSRVDLKDPVIVEILDIIERNARYTSQIVSRIQEPLKEVARVDVNVNAIIQDVGIRLEKAWKTDTTKPFVAIVLDLDETIPIIRAPSGQIAEVFSNLLDNARKAMAKGGEITVSSQLKDNVIYSRVKDAGPGIPPPIQERLFEKPVPSRDPGGGAGLGLWLSRLMLQSIGGDIFIEASDSSGTTMCVTIPVSP